MAQGFLNGTGLSTQQLRNLCLRYDRELAGVKDWMFRFLLIWTVLLLGFEWAEFSTGRAVPPAMSAAYGILLGGYIAHKEVLRWTGVTAKVRRGELFVYVWWGMLLLMFFLEYATGRFAIPEGMKTLAYEVLGYFVLSEISKAYNAWHVEKQHDEERASSS